MDEDGDYEDWIEIYNDGADIINLQGFSLTDNPNNPQKWIFPEVQLAPDSFLVIFASGKDRTTGAVLHTNFKISIDGESIMLSNSEGAMVDYMPNVVLTTDRSFGRLPDGWEEMIIFEGSTPGATNMEGTAYTPLEDSIYFSVEQGLHESSFDLELTNLNPDSKIYYTLDGSDPDTTDHLYQEPLFIQQNDTPNNISTIPTTDPGALHPYDWLPPGGFVFKGSVIKARSFQEGQTTSPVSVASYFVHENIKDKFNKLPIISIVTDSLHFFDEETGIYVPGIMADQNADTSWWGYGNFYGSGKNWEKPAHMSLFEGDGSLSITQNIGIRMHGFSTRSLPMKSLRLYARNQYGKDQFDYAFFPGTEVTRYKRILLRQGGNDFGHNYCADALSSLLTEDFNFLKQSYRPAVLLINGEFWGITNIRDRIDKYFMEYKTGLSADTESIDMLEGWFTPVAGNPESFTELLAYFGDNDLSDPAIYDYVSSQIDISNFIDFYIAKLYIGVWDWPGNNIRIWRNNSNITPWRWIFFDNDQCFQDPTFDSMEHATMVDGPPWPNPNYSTIMFRKLLTNAEFRGQFLDAFEFRLETSFTSQRFNLLLDSIVDLIGPVMEEHINRWQYPASLSHWEHEIKILRDFGDNRPCHMREILINYFEITNPDFAANVCDTITPSPEAEISDVIKVWPNPTIGELYIATAADSINEVIVSDITGRFIFRKQFPKAVEVAHITLPELSSGLYILRAETGHSTHVQQFVYR